MKASLHELIRKTILRLDELANEIHWAERNPDDPDPYIVNRLQWRERVLEARKNLPQIKAELENELQKIIVLLGKSSG